MKSWTGAGSAHVHLSSMSASATKVPFQPVGPGSAVHTTAVFTSTPLLLWDELMGYSATLVPFSSFLSGFLQRMGEGSKDTIVSCRWL